jgi:succinate dehydrogenase / fumarate reductase flavoprotein subunit
VAAQGGMAAARAREYGRRRQLAFFTCYDTIKGSGDWLGDQDAIEYVCREAMPAVLELEHYGVRGSTFAPLNGD